MDCEKILSSLQSKDFKKVINKCQKLQEGTTIYAKEIRKNIFLLFVFLNEERERAFHAFIANFDAPESIGIKEPLQLMFYLSVTKNEDLHYFEKYLR